MTTAPPAVDAAPAGSKRTLLFWACFVALITTAFGFIVRALVIGEWQAAYDLTETQKGEIFGVGLWPFAISIILFSLVIDRIGYGTAMVFAFACHVLSGLVTIFAPGYFFEKSGPEGAYWALYAGNFIVALGNGAVEAVINPVVATIFARQKTKWLSILHAGWPGGLVLGGVIVLTMDALLGEAAVAETAAVPADWRWKVALIFIPTAIYGVMMLFCRFPVSERVAAGVSDRDMLRELGWGGAYIASALMTLELFRVFNVYSLFGDPETMSDAVKVGGAFAFAIIPAALFGAAIGWAFGNKLLVFLLLVMCPLATTELGTDSWIADIMTPVVNNAFETTVGGGLVLIYTSFIMMVLRFFAGPIVHSISPLGLLAGSSAVAAVGLVLLAGADAATMVFVAATVYGFGKSFFWPTMLGVVAEQAPRGGALTLNVTGGVGMLAVGTVGAVFTGYFAEVNTAEALVAENPAVAEQVLEDDQQWVFGRYTGVEPTKVVGAEAKAAVKEASDDGKQAALFDVALFPCLMLAAYIALILYFRSRGGYAAVELTEGHSGPTTERDEKLAGAVPGPVR
ncbi:MFS transporter [Alienimonas californiensis]|uniref:Major Facilitator Superfamily protein n=1 Tax=Alienimonas californiensis TaxID=2527989 RepID=A0A517PD08_9PLAN|nr:MFS transporter [Alienimonas californiensis]QDT17268.1 Major Facilitator Superfamily protein [Alienimonas californiensis]